MCRHPWAALTMLASLVTLLALLWPSLGVALTVAAAVVASAAAVVTLNGRGRDAHK